jgi:hypothetical protein
LRRRRSAKARNRGQPQQRDAGLEVIGKTDPLSFLKTLSAAETLVFSTEAG